MKKKIISIIMVLITLLMLSACSNQTCSNQSNDTSINYENELIEVSKEVLSSFEFDKEQKFSVTVDNNGVYTININGVIQKLQINPSTGNKEEYTNIQEIENKKIMNICNSSKEKVVEYIKTSTVLQDKENLISYINRLEIKKASFLNGDGVAAYYAKQDCILINVTTNSRYICEAMIVHELIHALCQRTHNGIENEEFPYEIFNEVLTDLIAFSTEPSITSGIESGYAEYHQWGYNFIGTFGENAIKGYFYGYEGIPQEELEIYVQSVGQITGNNQKKAVCFLANLINYWNQKSN